MITFSEAERQYVNLEFAKSIISTLNIYHNPHLNAYNTWYCYSDRKKLVDEILRKWATLPSNTYMSKAAVDMFNLLTTASKSKFYKSYSHHSFRADNISQPVDVETYSANSCSNTFIKTINPGDKFAYVDVFFDEHLIPVADIKAAIFKVYEDHRDSADLPQRIMAIADKLCFAKILRTENQRVNKLKQSGRISVDDLINKSTEECFNQVYSQYYAPLGIELVESASFDILCQEFV